MNELFGSEKDKRNPIKRQEGRSEPELHIVAYATHMVFLLFITINIICWWL